MIKTNYVKPKESGPLTWGLFPSESLGIQKKKKKLQNRKIQIYSNAETILKQKLMHFITNIILIIQYILTSNTYVYNENYTYKHQRKGKQIKENKKA